MAQIHQMIGVKVPASKALAAVSTAKGVAGWWSKTVTGEIAKGKTFDVIFDTNRVIFKAVQLTSKKVVWKCIDDDYGMKGTTLTFKLKRKGSETLVFLTHSGMSNDEFALPFMTTKWALFMMSMKDYLEKGKGKPFPNDLHLMHGDFG